MQVPRTVEKREPYTYTVRMPRTVVTKVPLDACGNPLPAAPAAASVETVPAPTAARPAAPAMPAPSLKPADGGPVKTYSDKPADAAAAATDGWKASTLDHSAPASPTKGSEAIRAEKPAADAGTLKNIEPIPAPPARQPAAAAAAPVENTPTVAPLGPAVEPAPPVHDERDVPAAKTSGPGRGLIAIPSDHTT